MAAKVSQLCITRQRKHLSKSTSHIASHCRAKPVHNCSCVSHSVSGLLCMPLQTSDTNHTTQTPDNTNDHNRAWATSTEFEK